MDNRLQLILGSSSPFRKELLERLQLPFTTCSPEVDETPLKDEKPKDLSLRLSILKAQAVAAQHPDCVVIGCDQVLELDGKQLGKPGCFEKAFEQLSAMSGKEVVFHSAMTVIDAKGNVSSTVVPTEIKMRDLPPEAIRRYLEIEKPFRCAGSAKIEKLGIALIAECRSSDPTAIIGLPLIELTTMLAKAGISVLPELR